jgi:hypothetical protein
MNIVKNLKLLYYAFVVVGLFATLVSATTTVPNQASTLSASLCGIVSSIRTVIGVLALLLFIAGGSLYAGAHMLPAAGNLRGNLQGWSMGMIMGGIVGIILVLLAPYLVGMIINLGGTSSGIQAPSCG